MAPAPSRSSSEHAAAAARPGAVLAAVALGVLAAAGTLVWSSVATTSARFAATTEARSLFEAADIELRLGDATSAEPGAAASAAVQIEAAQLAPGVTVERCLPITYRGSLDDVRVRLHAERAGGSGLERYVQAVLIAGTGTGPDCGDFGAAREVYRGTLEALWASHGSFEEGIALLDGAADGTSLTVRVELAVVGGNEAQGLDSAFWLVLEARP